MIYAIFFLSGVSGLLFQHIWFRQAGLVFGNSVVASSLVLSSFMAGLAIGNGLAATRSIGRRQPLRSYAWLEMVVAGTGLSLVFLLPLLGETFLNPLARMVSSSAGLGFVRFSLAFILLVIPTAAMGMTLPVLVGHAPSRDRFGITLGRLYGFNTLGAVLGAVLGEAWLYEWIGIRSTAFVAASMNVVAALLSLRLSRTDQTAPPEPAHVSEGAWRADEIRLMIVAGLAGACLLALEVVGTRFLLLSVFGAALTFSIVLALVLSGIALGSLIASRLPGLFTSPSAVAVLCLFGSIAITTSYASFVDVLKLNFEGLPGLPWTRVGCLSAALIFPAALISGALFTSLGTALGRTRQPSRAVGFLTLSNTLGATVGALGAGLILLPGLGMERSFQVIALGYALAAALSPGFWSNLRTSRALAGAAALALAFGALFPVGLMDRAYLRIALRPFATSGFESRPSGFREGLTETIVYMDTLAGGETLHTRLITNAFSMSGTMFSGRRYMEAFVYLPVAIHPRVRSALLVSYGVGATARALVETKEIERIDVVDISRDILDMAPLAVRPGDPAPLKDPRVVTHVEDGRFFLETTDRGFDLITSEPPPPHLGGVVNLYTREYFELLRKRLNPGGIVSYWLPVHALTDLDSRSISSAFCAVFEDCTLWKGMNLNWMLIGTRDFSGPVSVERFQEQWNGEGPKDLEELGFERPEQMGATFMAEGRDFKDLTNAPPLEDNYPGRLSRFPPEAMNFGPWRRTLMDSSEARKRFLTSAFVKKAWPASMLADSLPYFDVQRHFDQMLSEFLPAEGSSSPIVDGVSLLKETPLTMLPAVLLGTPADMRILVNRVERRGGVDADWFHLHAGIRDIGARRFDSAVTHLRRAIELNPKAAGLRERLTLALCLGGRTGEAKVERANLTGSLDPQWPAVLATACDGPSSSSVPRSPSSPR